MLRSIKIKTTFGQLSISLLLALAVGCQRGETPKEAAPSVPEKTVASKEEKTPAAEKKLTGREVLSRMAEVYQKAATYADAGQVHLLAEDKGEAVIDESANFSLTFERPNKIRMQAYQAMMTSDGKEIHASIEDLPNQVLVKPAPAKLTLKSLYADRILAMAMSQGIGGAMPQVMLLLADEPLKILLRDSEGADLLESSPIEGRECYRVEIKRPDGAATFWIDQETYILRRVVLPTDEIRRAINANRSVDRVSLVAELSGASIDGKIDPKAYAFDVPQGAEIVKFFIPPHIAQLLSKRVPDFQFTGLDGKPFTAESLAGKITVFDFWATWCGPCKLSLPNLQKVYEQFKDNSRVAFYAVSVDQPDVKNDEIEKTLSDIKVSIPVLRALEQSAAPFKFTNIPTSFIIGADGIVQDYEVGGSPNLAQELPEKIEKLLAGENIYEKPLKEYQEQLDKYAKMVEQSQDVEIDQGGQVIEERKLPEVKTAERSEPKTLKLTSLWKCADVKMPGNIVVLPGKDGPARLAVVENWKSIAEIGLDGKLIAMHNLDLSESEVVGSLRTNVGADGKRYIVAFLTTQQRCHLIDENWKLLRSYPEDALQNPHSGIADVELGDLDGDGKLKLYVSYWGVVGVQSASLEGERLWSNRSVSNAISIAIGPADDKGQRNLYCTNNAGSLIVLDAKGEQKGEVKVPDQMLHWIFNADLNGDGALQWCGMTAPKLGENVAVGFTPDGKDLWHYTLPVGVQPQPIEPIIAGRVAREGPGQWILPAPDGSVHIVAADGKPIDQYNAGVTLQGLATVEIDGQPAIVISSADGLEAWKVEAK